MNADSRSCENDLSTLKADVAVMRSLCVTNADLQEVRIELKAEIQAVRSELKAHFQSLSSELGSVKLDIGKVSADNQIDIEKLRAEVHAMGENFSDAIVAQTWKIVGFAAVLAVASHLAAGAGF